MGRRKSSAVEDIIEIGSMLPWWLSLIAAAVTYLLFHFLAQIEPGTAAGAGDVGPVVARR